MGNQQRRGSRRQELEPPDAFLQGTRVDLLRRQEPELVDFSDVSGAHTVFNWTYEHLMVPDKISPKTTMPTFSFKPQEARALTLVLLSWRREEFPPEYIPPPIEEPPATPNSSP